MQPRGPLLYSHTLHYMRARPCDRAFSTNFALNTSSDTAYLPKSKKEARTEDARRPLWPPQYDARINAAKPEGIGQNGIHAGVPSLVPNVVQVALGVGVTQVDRRWQIIALQRQAAYRESNAPLAPRACPCMALVPLSGTR